MLDIKKNKMLKKLAYFTIDFPIARQIYSKMYLRKIRKYLAKHKNESLSIEPFNACNLRCIMCPYPDMKRPKVNMSIDTFRDVIDQAKEIGIKNVMLTSYNEPFLDEMLFERIKYVKDNGMEIAFFSNGTVMTKEKAEKLLECPPDRIIFSFDSNDKETYEKIRVGANFEKTKSNIEQLIILKKKKNIKLPIIQINFLQMSVNEKEIEDIINYWKDKADRVEIGFVDNRKDNETIKLGIREESKYAYPCPRAFFEWTVLSDGRVTFCGCQDYDGKYIIGDVKKDRLKDILNSEKYNSYKKLHLECKGDKIGLCKNCNHMRKAAFSWWANRGF